MRFPSVTAHGIQHTGPCRVSGSHLSLAPNSERFIGLDESHDALDAAFSEAELVRADALRNVDKAQRWHEENDQCAMSLQVQRMRDEGAL